MFVPVPHHPFAHSLPQLHGLGTPPSGPAHLRNLIPPQSRQPGQIRANGIRNPWIPDTGQLVGRPASEVGWANEAQLARGPVGMGMGTGTGTWTWTDYGGAGDPPSRTVRAGMDGSVHSSASRALSIAPAGGPGFMVHSHGQTAPSHVGRHVMPDGSVSGVPISACNSVISSGSGGDRIARSDDGWLGSVGRAHRGFEPDMSSVAGGMPLTPIAPASMPVVHCQRLAQGQGGSVPLPIPRPAGPAYSHMGSRRDSMNLPMAESRGVPIGLYGEHSHAHARMSHGGASSRRSSCTGSPGAHSPRSLLPNAGEGGESGLYRRRSIRR